MAPGGIHHPRSRALGRRPEVAQLTVTDLVRGVRDGVIRVPPFQRPMRWTDDDRASLIDSIYRGYPIGTLLFWKGPADRGPVQIGRTVLEVPGTPDARWVIDGQQRIATLLDTLSEASSTTERTLYFDLDHASFIWQRPHRDLFDMTRAAQIPTAALLDTSALQRWISSQRDLSSGRVWHALDASRRIAEYRAPTYVLEEADDAVVRDVFERVNRTGYRLTDAEVFDALNAVRGQRGSSLQTLSDRSSPAGWGVVADEVALRTLRAIEQLTLTGDVPRLAPDRADAVFDRTAAALRRATTFLRHDAHVPHSALLPYGSALVVLGRFFDVFPDPHVRTRTLLRRWLWRAMLGLGLTGAITDLRRWLRQIDPESEAQTVQRLLTLVTAKDVASSVAAIDPFHGAQARTLLHLCALASLTPRDLVTGAPVDLASAFARHVAKLPSVSRAADRRSAARFILQAMKPAQLIKAIAACPDQATLDSHGVTADARARLARGTLEEFVSLRHEALVRVSRDFFSRAAEWGADDSPPLTVLAPAEDDE